MTQSVEIQELAIVVAAQNHSPTMLNLEFLKCSGVVPTDWQVSAFSCFQQPSFSTDFSERNQFGCSSESGYVHGSDDS